MFRELMLLAIFLTLPALSVLPISTITPAESGYTVTSVTSFTNTTVSYEVVTKTFTATVVQAQSQPIFTNTVTITAEGWQAVSYTVTTASTAYYILENQPNASATGGLNGLLQVALSFLSPAAIVGVAAIVVAVILYRAQKSKKSLTYEVLSDFSLLRTQQELEGRLQMLFDSKPIKNAYLLVVRLQNTGNTSITQADFEGPLSIVLGKDAQVLTLDVAAKKPEALKPQLRAESGRIIIDPLLLNSKDSFNVKAVVSQYDRTKLRIEGRIAGVKEIKQPPSGSRRQEVALVLTALLAIISMGFTLWNVRTMATGLAFYTVSAIYLLITIVILSVIIAITRKTRTESSIPQTET